MCEGRSPYRRNESAISLAISSALSSPFAQEIGHRMHGDSTLLLYCPAGHAQFAFELDPYERQALRSSVLPRGHSDLQAVHC